LVATTVLTAIIVIGKAGSDRLSNRPRQQLEYAQEQGGPEALEEARAWPRAVARNPPVAYSLV